LAGCGSDDKSDTDLMSEAAVREGSVSRSLGGKLKIKATGPAFSTSIDTEHALRMVTLVSRELPSNGWLLSIGTDDLLDAGNGALTKVAFDLVGYHGPGEYVIGPSTAGGLSEEELRKQQQKDGKPDFSKSARSDSFIVVVRGQDVTNYNVIVKDCTVKVTKLALSGTMKCPALSNTKDQISLTWSWKADPNKVLDDSANSTVPSTTTTAAAAPTTTTAPKKTTTTSSTQLAAQTTGNTVPDKPTIKADVPLDVDVSPQCVEPAGLVTVRVSTIPDAAISLAPGYEGQATPTYELGRTDAQGKYRWVFTVQPTAKEGRGTVMVAVSSSDNQHGGGGVVPFDIKKRC
jgi:hypothetical protein